MGHVDAAPSFASAATLAVTVICSPAPGTVESIVLHLPAGAVVADAIVQSGFAARHPALAGDAVRVGVWGTLRDRADRLEDGDRVELYRPLAADPKDARRARAQRMRRAAGGAQRTAERAPARPKTP